MVDDWGYFPQVITLHLDSSEPLTLLTQVDLDPAPLSDNTLRLWLIGPDTELRIHFEDVRMITLLRDALDSLLVDAKRL